MYCQELSFAITLYLHPCRQYRERGMHGPGDVDILVEQNKNSHYGERSCVFFFSLVFFLFVYIY